MYNKKKLKGLIFANLSWLLLRRILIQVIYTASNLILVRILFPEDFGTFAILAFVISFCGMITDFGFHRALVQRHDEPDLLLLRSVWWSQVMAAILMAGIVWIISPLLIGYYVNQVDAKAVDWLRILIIVQILTNMTFISNSLLERGLHYSRILIAEVLILFSTQVTTILFAWMGYGVISFIIGFTVGKVIGFIALTILCPWSWGINWSYKKIKTLFSYGFSSQFGVILALINSAVIPVIIGRFPGPGIYTGAQAVGFLTWAGGVAALPIIITSIFDQLLFPLMSRLQKQPDVAAKVFGRFMRMAILATSIIAVLLFILAPEVTSILYSERFLPALPALRILIVQVLLFSLTNLAMTTLLAFGEVPYYRNMNLLWVILQWILTLFFVFYFGFWGVSIASFFVTLTSIHTFIRLNRHFRFIFNRVLLTPIIIAIVTGVVIFIVIQTYPIKSLLWLLADTALGVFIYSILVYIFLKQHISEDISYMLDIVMRANQKK